MKSGTQKLKKFLAFVMTSVMVLTAVPLGGLTFNASAENDGYYTYTVKNGEATITDCDEGISGDVVIPDTLGGYPVTRIGNGAFSGCTGLTSVTIPDSVTSIGERAFDDCTGLTSLTIGNSVTSIGACAFSDCYGLTSVTIGNSVTNIGDSAFYSCSGLTSVTIGNSVTSIGVSAFSGCKGLTSLTIPDSVTSIGDSAFEDCTGLTNITIPDSITRIERYAFVDCTNLTSITIPSSVTDIGDYAFGYYHESTYKLKKVENFTIYGYTGTAAETYANKNGFAFIALGGEHTHTYSAWVVTTEPTCTALGEETRTCSICGATETRPVEKKAHDLFRVEKASTCKVQGVSYDVCDSCGNTFNYTVLPLAPHTFGDWAVKTESTCTAEGEEARTCSVCGATETKTIAAAGHNDNNSDGICDSCGEDLGTHTPSENCSCGCHKKGIAKLFFKIKLFFQKIFKKNRVCKCGVNHY